MSAQPFDPALHAEHRARFLTALGTDAAIVVAPPHHRRNADTEYKYRQSSDLLYLTGWSDPEAVALFRPGSDAPFVLFCQPKDPEMETWTGRRAGPEGAVQAFGASQAFPIGEIEERLPKLLLGVSRLHHRWGEDASFDALLARSVAKARRLSRKERLDTPKTFIDPELVLHELRLFKSGTELARLRRAAEITCAAHEAAMRTTRPGVFEYELEAVIDGTFRRLGGMGPGYGTIVAGGDNATILHYVTNDMALRDGDLVCVDAGCEFGWYTADVTRTWPVCGRFTAAQRELYEIVLDAELRAIEAVRPGAPVRGMHDTAVRVLTEGMVRTGLLQGDVDVLIASEAFKKYYMHGTGHWLGLDVHDAGRYYGGGESRVFEPGMVTTVEPGLYVRADDMTAPERFRGIGIRIEDDVLVTLEGNEVLTASIPKSVDDVERTVLSGR